MIGDERDGGAHPWVAQPNPCVGAPLVRLPTYQALLICTMGIVIPVLSPCSSLGHDKMHRAAVGRFGKPMNPLSYAPHGACHRGGVDRRRKSCPLLGASAPVHSRLLLRRRLRRWGHQFGHGRVYERDAF